MMSAQTYNQLQLKVLEKLILLLARAWLGKAKGHSCHKRVKVRSTPATTLQKDPFK